METQCNETTECVMKKTDSLQVHNLKIEPKLEEREPDCSEMKKVEIIQTKLLTEKADLFAKNSEHNDDIDNSKECENPSENIDKISFKKPSLLIGPRRGKQGLLKPVSGTISKEPPDALRTEINVSDEKNSEREKILSCDKQQIPLQYKEPSWSGPPEDKYKIEVLKSGVILEIIDLSKKNFFVVGRLPTCDISLAHPTISRYHAIFQYRHIEDEKQPKGFYIYDLGSTHGTFWNGCKIRPNTYARLQGGHMIRFGCSQRKFIIQTPPDDMEDESEYSVTELKEQRRLLMLEREKIAREEQEQAEEEERLRLEREEKEGIDWGMGEDADEETDLTENPYASTNNEELFLDDPKKTLRGWFEREGHELQYETEEKGIGQFLCWVDLPIDGVGGRSVRAEAIVKGKKKESVIQCALEACRILDRHGVLRQATHEARKRKTRNWEEEDFYDSDEDNFLDRTGTVEKKRQQRMRQAGKLEEKVETYASLVEKHTSIIKKIADIESQIKRSQKLKEDIETSNEDALDAFMSSLNSNVYDKAGIRKMKLELQSLRKEEESLMKLVNITRPANLPTLTSQQYSDDLPKSINENNSSKLPNKRFGSSTKKSVLKREMVNVESATIQSSEEAPGIADSTVRLIEEQTKIMESPVTKSPEREESKPMNDDGSVTSTDVKEKSETELAKKKMKNMKRMQQRAGKVVKETPKGYGDETFDEDYSMWLPPQNQSGDGKTSLNDKYGY